MDEGEMKVVEGEDVRKYYNANYNLPGGTLENSCMRYDRCRKFFDIYVECAKMLVCYKKDVDKIQGRAILWKIDGKTYMDRVYTNKDYLLNTFIDYAKEQKWIIRDNHHLLDSGDQQGWLIPDDNYTESQYLDLVIRPGKVYDYYPYLDTFRYLDECTGAISTNPNFSHCCCDFTDGSYSIQSTCYTCECCGMEEWADENDGPDDLHWSEHDECWYCDDCGYYCSEVCDWVLRNDLVSYYLKPNVYIKIPDWAINSPGYSFDGVCIDGQWYDEDYDGLVKTESGEYKIIDNE